jgi:hypothetical protein
MLGHLDVESMDQAFVGSFPFQREENLHAVPLGGRSFGSARHWQPVGKHVEYYVMHLALIHRTRPAAVLGGRDQRQRQRPSASVRSEG